MNLENMGLTRKKLDLDTFPENILYVGVAGFEDRSLAFLKHAIDRKKLFKKCIAIEYRPVDLTNRKDDFRIYAEKLFSDIQWAVYDRFYPEDFVENIKLILEWSRDSSRIIVDISGMSKMLIMTLLYGLRKINLPLSIVYARAAVYHPTKEEFEKKKNSKKSNNTFPYFLTSHVFDVVTTTELSSIAMQGAPILLIAFPNFNYLEVAALLNTTNAQKLFLIESINDIKKNKWRLEAIRWINRGLKTQIAPTIHEVDASDLNSTVKILEGIYSDWHLTHKIILSPTGGKLQTLASFCLKIMHPDIHIIYPVVKEFENEYTEGFLKHTEMFIENFCQFTDKLSSHRKRLLMNF